MGDLQADNRTLTAQLERAKKGAEETTGELQTAKTKYLELKVEADQAVEAARRKEEAAHARARQLEVEVDQLRSQVTQYTPTIKTRSLVVTERDAALAANEACNARLVTIPRRSKTKNNKTRQLR
jgi:chromosome condensin MukBEF ATPase and DNA-binding subunit MukB